MSRSTDPPGCGGGCPGLGGGAEAGEHLDLHREVGEALQGGHVVLLGQHGGGHQEGCLLALQHALHDGPEGHLRFAVAHVPAEQAVHGHGLFHVAFDLLGAAELVLGLRIGGRGLKLPLPGGVRGEGVARQPLPLGIELDEALGHVLGGLFGLGLGLLPLRAPQFGQAQGAVLPPPMYLDTRSSWRAGDVEGVCPGELEFDVVPGHPVHGHLHHAHEPADAVVLVDHQVPGGQVGEGLQPLAAAVPTLAFRARGLRGQGLPLGEDGKLPVGEVQPRRQAPPPPG